LDLSVRLYGDDPAIKTNAETISFRELQARSAAMAKGLLAAGATKGSRIALLGGNTPFWIISYFACAQVGALVPCISSLATPAELAYMLRHCDAQMLLMGRRFANRDYAEILAKALPSLAAVRDRGPLRLSEAPYLRSIWTDDAEGVTWAGSTAQLAAAGQADPALDDAFLDEVKSELHASDDAIIIYTSGSTTVPKAVVHTQSIARKAKPLAELQGVLRGHHIVPLAPMFWVGGMNILLESIAVGGVIVLPDGPSSRNAVDVIKKFGADRMYGWPVQMAPIREIMDAEGFDYSRTWGLRTELMPDGTPKPANRNPNSLGMTETFGPHNGSPHGQILPDHRLGAFGPPFFGFERRIVDPETGEEVPQGEVGELYLRGGSLMKGFYKMERSEIFTPDGFYGTKDLVRVEPDGYSYLQGRTGDMLKTRGANVSRVEVDAALRSLPGVAEAVVCGVPDPVMGQKVLAAVVPKPGEQVSEEALLAGLKELIAGYKAPARILVIEREDLIMSASGKVRIPEMGELIVKRLALAG